MLKEIIKEIREAKKDPKKLPKKLRDLLKYYDPAVNFIDDGQLYDKVWRRNQEIRKEFEKEGYDINDYIDHPSLSTVTIRDPKINYASVLTELKDRALKGKKACPKFNDMIDKLDDSIKNNKYFQKDILVLTMNRFLDNKVASISITKDGVFCSGDKKLLDDIHKNFEKYLMTAYKDGWKFKGWSKTIPLEKK